MQETRGNTATTTSSPFKHAARSCMHCPDSPASLSGTTPWTLITRCRTSRGPAPRFTVCRLRVYYGSTAEPLWDTRWIFLTTGIVKASTRRRTPSSFPRPTAGLVRRKTRPEKDPPLPVLRFIIQSLHQDVAIVYTSLTKPTNHGFYARTFVPSPKQSAPTGQRNAGQTVRTWWKWGFRSGPGGVAGFGRGGPRPSETSSSCADAIRSPWRSPWINFHKLTITS